MTKKIGSFQTKVSVSVDKKILSTGKTKNYEYGSISLRNPLLNDYIGQHVKVTITPLAEE